MEWREPNSNFTIEEYVYDIQKLIEAIGSKNNNDAPKYEFTIDNMLITTERSVYTDEVIIVVVGTIDKNIVHFISKINKELEGSEYTIEAEYGTTAVVEKIGILDSSKVFIRMVTNMEQIEEII